MSADPSFNNGDYTSPPVKGLEAFAMLWAGWLYSQEWSRRELWKASAAPGTTFEQYSNSFKKRFGADANDFILQAKAWERHDISKTPGSTVMSRRL